MTSISSPKATDDPFGLPLITSAWYHVGTTALDTEALALSAREFGTVCRAAYGHWTSATNILKHCWRQICFDRATALCDILYKRLRNILTYLLTLLTRPHQIAPWLNSLIIFTTYFILCTYNIKDQNQYFQCNTNHLLLSRDEWLITSPFHLQTSYETMFRSIILSLKIFLRCQTSGSWNPTLHKSAVKTLLLYGKDSPLAEEMFSMGQLRLLLSS